MPTTCIEQAPVPPPSYSRAQVQAQAQRARALHINALTLIQTLHLLAVCRLAVQLAQRRCPAPLAKGPGGAPRTYRQESLLLIALLKTRLPALLSRRARLAGQLACLGIGLWLAAACRWHATHPQSVPTV